MQTDCSVKKIHVLILYVPCILQAAHREAYAREDAESPLREGTTGQTQSEVSTNESAGIIKKNQVRILILSSCWWKWLQQLVFVRNWTKQFYVINCVYAQLLSITLHDGVFVSFASCE